MKREAAAAEKTEKDVDAAQLPWEAMPNLLGSKYWVRIEEGDECVKPYQKPAPDNQPFYCPCVRGLQRSTEEGLRWPDDRETFGNSGINIHSMRKVQRAALKLLIYAFALVLPLGLALQLSYRTLFGTEDSPSMLVVLFTDPKRFHRWLQEDLRRVAAITVMGVPMVLFIAALMMLCLGDWQAREHARVLATIGGILTLPCAWGSYLLCQYCPGRRIVVASIPICVPLICLLAAAVLGCPRRNSYCPSRPFLSASIFLLLPCAVVSWVLFEAWPSLVQTCSGYLYAKHSKAAETSSKASVTVRSTFVNNPCRIVLSLIQQIAQTVFECM